MSIEHTEFNAEQGLAKQRELFEYCFPEAINTPVLSNEHYFWKFHSFPNTLKSCEYASYDQEKMLGYYAALPYRYKVNNKILLAGMVCDVMTHPEARGTGIFTKIGFYATDALSKQGFDFTTGYPVRPEVIPGHMKVGWEIVLQLPMFVKMIELTSLCKSMKMGFFSYLANPLLKIYNALLHARIKKTNARTECMDAQTFFDNHAEAYTKFIEKWSAQQNYCLIKDMDFLKWRLGAPQQKYYFIVCYDETNLQACAVIKFAKLKGIPTLAILDFMSLASKVDSLSAMHSMLRATAVAHHAEAIAVMQSRRIAKKLSMRRYGYMRSPYQFKLIVKKLSNQFKENKINYNDAHIMWIDSDDL